MGRGTRFVAVVAATGVALLVGAGSASATFHLMKLREVSAGTGPADSSYVEIQAYAPLQKFLSGGATVVRCDSTCSTPSVFNPFTDVANGNNQDTVVFGDSGLAGGSKDFTVDGLNLDAIAAGGAVCYVSEPGYNDCVSWGNFSGNSTLMTNYGTSAGTPAARAQLRNGAAALDRRGLSNGARAGRRHRQQRGRLRRHDAEPAAELRRAHGDGLRTGRPRQSDAAEPSQLREEEKEVQEEEAQPGDRQPGNRHRNRQPSRLRGQEDEVQEEEAEVATPWGPAASPAVR